MMHRRLLSPLFLLTLLIALPTTELTSERVAWAEEAEENEDDRASFVEIWGQGQGGWTHGVGANIFEGGGLPNFGFAAGVEILFIGAFIDVRIQDFGVEEGTWNQIGLYSRINLPKFSVVEPYVDIRTAYLYAQFSTAAAEAYLESGNATESPANKGLNTSALIGLDIGLVGPLYVGLAAEVGYHLLLPDADMGFNYHAQGYLRLKFGL